MNHGWIGVIAGIMLAGTAHAQPAVEDPASPSGEPPVAVEVPETDGPEPDAPWPTPAVPAFGTPSSGDFPEPRQVIRVSNPPPQRFPTLRRPPSVGQVIEMPAETPSWYERFRPGRGRMAAPVSMPVGMPQSEPITGGPPQMLPEFSGDHVILMEKSAQDQLPPPPGDVPPSSGSPTEPLQQLPQPRPLDMAEPMVEEFEVPPGQWWFGVEYLLWFVERPRLPIPLLTTTSAAGTMATTSTGALSSSTTQVLFDAEGLRHGNYPGGRFSIGYWFAPERIFGLEANVLVVQASDVEVVLSGSDISSGVLSRPFVNAATGVQQAAVVAFPTTQTGTVSILSTSQLVGGEINLAAKFIRGVDSDWDLIVGLRYLELEESLDVNQNTLAGLGNNLRFGGNAVTRGSVVTAFDRFDTRNRFTGAQFGVRKESRLANMILGCQFKVAAGATRQTITIDGGSTLTAAGTSATTFLPGGLLALPTNIGQVVVNDFAVIPQLQFTLGYQCMEHLRLWVSYECLLWTNTARPGDQIDPLVNVTQVPTSASFGTFTGPVRPAVLLEQESLLLQGISVGMELKY